MQESIAQNYLFLDTDAEIWKHAESTYSHKGNATQIYQLRRKIFLLRQGDRSPFAYYLELTQLYQEYDHFDSLAMICNADALLLSWNTTTLFEGFTLVAHQPNFGGRVSHDFKPKPTDKDHLTCDYCGKPRHTRDTCFILHDFPPRGGLSSRGGCGHGRPSGRLYHSAYLTEIPKGCPPQSASFSAEEMQAIRRLMHNLATELTTTSMFFPFESEGKVCLLKKALYGLKKSPKAWEAAASNNPPVDWRRVGVHGLQILLRLNSFEPWVGEAITKKCSSFGDEEWFEDSLSRRLRAFNSLLRKLHKYVPYGSSVADLYSGAGEPLHWLKGSNVVIVDPPKKGLGQSLLDALREISNYKDSNVPKSSIIKEKEEKRPWMLRARESTVHMEGNINWEKAQIWPEFLIYVSCGWESFKKDCLYLLSNNAWHLEKAHAFNFFPGTERGYPNPNTTSRRRSPFIVRRPSSFAACPSSFIPLLFCHHRRAWSPTTLSPAAGHAEGAGRLLMKHRRGCCLRSRSLLTAAGLQSMCTPTTSTPPPAAFLFSVAVDIDATPACSLHRRRDIDATSDAARS
ncbi:hypothetical protein KSP39_PZI003888 [Platanthera zijinensis]|uniref:Uncharacterized protein n=1 Tax=Platanthera zijinensis TaxID=2320716 RepID=A0AAP0BVW4_9ASPA